MEAEKILVEQISKNDRQYRNSAGVVTGEMHTYVLMVLPQDILTVLRSVAFDELDTQIALRNKPSQILVDSMPTGRRSIERAMRNVKIRFQDTEALLTAIKEVYALLVMVTRLQSPAKDAIVARRNFHLWLDGKDLGLMPAALSRVTGDNTLTVDSVLRVVGPLVNYGRKLFWNPVGASSKMNFYRVKSAKAKSGVRFMPLKGSNATAPRFKPWAPRTLRRKANRTADPAATLSAMMAGATPPGRVENTGQIVTRIVRRNPTHRGLHFAAGWVQYSPAVTWSKLRDPRVPSIAVMFAKKGAVKVV